MEVKNRIYLKVLVLVILQRDFQKALFEMFRAFCDNPENVPQLMIP